MVRLDMSLRVVFEILSEIGALFRERYQVTPNTSPGEKGMTVG